MRDWSACVKHVILVTHLTVMSHLADSAVPPFHPAPVTASVVADSPVSNSVAASTAVTEMANTGRTGTLTEATKEDLLCYFVDEKGVLNRILPCGGYIRMLKVVIKIYTIKRTQIALQLKNLKAAK